MPTRRIFEMTVLTVVLLKPIFGVTRLWAAKTLADPRVKVGSPLHGIAEIATVIS